MQSASTDLLKENIQDSYVANRVASTTEDPNAMIKTAGIMVPTWFVLTQAMDKFAKHSRGEYENTLQYKIGKFGDKIADNSFTNSKPMQAIGKGFKSVSNFIKKNILDKTRITRAMMNTPSIPENSMALANFKDMPAIQLFDYPQHGEAFVKPLKSAADLDCYGATKAEIESVQRQIASATTKEAKAKILQEAEHNTLLKYSRDVGEARRLANGFATADAAGRARILQDMKAFEWGYKDFADMKKLAEHTHNNIPEIFEDCHKANPKMFARIWGTNASAVGKASTVIVGREVYASETLNKLFAELGNLDLTKPENAKWKEALERTGYINKLPKTAFAKILNKYVHLCTEGATNRVAGGKLVALMQAWFLAEAIYKSSQAKGGIGEKGRTFAERVTELVAMFACIPLALKLMHSVGGLQYAGMTPEQVTKYRENLKSHNEKAMAGGFANEAEWKASKKALETELRAGVKNPFVRLAKRIGRTVAIGLEQIRPYDKKSIGVFEKDGTVTYRKGIGQKIKDLFRHPKFGLKQMAGYPMRIILGMLIIQPFLTKLAVKGSHMIFGKPKNSVLDEGKEPESQQPQAPPQLNPQTTQQTQVVPPINQAQTQNNSDTNLLNRYKNQQQAGQSQQTQMGQNQTVQQNNEPKRTYIPSPEGVKIINPENERNYIPSPIGVRLNGTEDLTPANQAMQRADIAEQKALEALKMN